MNRDEFFKISISDLLIFKEGVPFCLYYKINEHKFIKITKELENNNERILTYQEKGVHYLYIDSKKIIEFKRFERDYYKKTATQSQFKVYYLSLSYIEDFFDNNNLIASKDFQEKAVETIGDSIEKIFENDSLRILFFKFVEFCELRYKKSVERSILSLLSLEKNGLISKKIEMNLTLACMLSELVYYQSNNKQVPDVYPIKTANILRQLGKGTLSEETIEIILLQNKCIDGSGIPEDVSLSEITLLSAIYIYSKAFQEFLLKDVSELTLKTFNDKFNVGIFSKLVKRPLVLAA